MKKKIGLLIHRLISCCQILSGKPYHLACIDEKNNLDFFTWMDDKLSMECAQYWIKIKKGEEQVMAEVNQIISK